MPSLGVSLLTAEFDDPRSLVDLGVELEAAGVDHLFVTESRNDVLTLLAALAVRTRRAAIGSAIAVIFHRHPYILAAAAAQIDRLSGERLVLGIGTGHRVAVEGLLHLEWGDASARLRDTLAALRASLDAAGPINHRNPHFQIGALSLFYPPRRRVPIALAALTAGTVRLAGLHGDGIITSLATIDQVRRFRSLLERSARDAGRDPAHLRVYSVIHVCLRADRAEAREVARHGLGYARLPFYQRQFARAGLPQFTGPVPDEVLDAVAICGPPDYARERLAAWREAGVDVPLLAPCSSEPDRAEAYRSFVQLM
ncbi:MAG: LLM class flavin-dependent oxidoreductase [Chloroflexota bacterium]|nr:LLM class flavin-dependent oxidoreductase [Dehalococcoidia bacterium]MDW8254282.1 LLM class flavin-dependent oxidoreductase [Chloroflexota bacterium]